MAIIVKYDEFLRENISAGLHQAECLFVEDIGFQEITYNDKTKTAHQILVGWEILDEKKSNGEAFVVNKKYTLSFFPTSNLRKTLESWFAKKFEKEELSAGIDITKIIGRQCMLNISLSENNYPLINSVSPLPKNMPVIKKTIDGIPPYTSKYIQKLREQSIQDGDLSHVSSDNKYKEAYENLDSEANMVKIEDLKDEDVPF